MLSDSLLRCVDGHEFLPQRDVAIYSFSGMRSNELVEVVYNRFYAKDVKADTFVICIGANDYQKPETTFIVDDIRKIVSMLNDLSSLIVLCTVPDGFWKNSKGKPMRFTYEQLQRPRGLLNREILGMAESDKVKVLDLDALFAGHHGWASESTPGYYHKDSLHPNSRGTMAMESALKQLLNGEEVVIPHSVESTKEEDQRRSLICKENYAKTNLK